MFTPSRLIPEGLAIALFALPKRTKKKVKNTSLDSDSKGGRETGFPRQKMYLLNIEVSSKASLIVTSGRSQSGKSAQQARFTDQQTKFLRVKTCTRDRFSIRMR
jgi:hypothetical protein